MSIILSPVGRSSMTARVTRQNLCTSSIRMSPMACFPNSSNERSHTFTPFKVRLNFLRLVGIVTSPRSRFSSAKGSCRDTAAIILGRPPKKYCKRTCVTRATSFWHTLGVQMTKTELLIAIAQATETNRRTAGVFLETLSALAYKEIKKNGEFVLPGFGKLVKQKRKARTGFNPKTQQKIKIPAKTVVKFRVAKAAKDAVLGVKK